MKNYLVETPRSEYEIEAKDKTKLRKLILEKENITFGEVEEEAGLIYLEQDNRKWAETFIGETELTIGKYGCLIVSLSMLSYWYGEYITPVELAEDLNYTENGLLYWRSIDRVLPFNFVWRYYSRDTRKIQEILFSEDNACVVEVKAFGARHWLLLINYTGGRYFAIDPLTADVVDVEKEYGLISGFAEVTRN